MTTKYSRSGRRSFDEKDFDSEGQQALKALKSLAKSARRIAVATEVLAFRSLQVNDAIIEPNSGTSILQSHVDLLLGSMGQPLARKNRRDMENITTRFNESLAYLEDLIKKQKAATK